MLRVRLGKMAAKRPDEVCQAYALTPTLSRGAGEGASQRQ
jgi:hypothetical protein